MNIQNSEKFYAQAQNFMPGGVNSPVRACRAVGRAPLFIDHAKGSKSMMSTATNTSIIFAHGARIFSDTLTKEL